VGRKGGEESGKIKSDIMCASGCKCIFERRLHAGGVEWTAWFTNIIV